MPQLHPTEKPVIKVVVCGDRFVGKSSAVSSWTRSKKHGQFVEKRKISNQEHTVEITRIEIKNVYFVDFYDIVGWSGPPSSSKNYNSSSSILAENTSFVLIVYDTSNHQSWINAKTTWLDWFEHHSPNVNIMLLGTKTDAGRKVASIKDCESFCKSFILQREESGDYGVGNGLFFMEVSPKYGTNMDLTLSILLIRTSHLVSMLKNEEFSDVSVQSSLSTDEKPPQNCSMTLLSDQNDQCNLKGDPNSRRLVPSLTSSTTSLEPSPLYNNNSVFQLEKTPTSQLKKKVSSSSQTPPDFHRSKSIPLQPTTDLISSVNDCAVSQSATSDVYGINASGYIVLPPPLTENTQHQQEEQPLLLSSSSQKKNHFQKVQSYQETREGFIIPIIETDLFPVKINGYRPIQTTYDNAGAKLILSINLGEGKICKIGVVSGDNIFQLADLVVKQHQVDSKMRQEIAFNIRNSINKYIEKQQGYDSFKKLNNPKIREAEQFNQTAHSLFQNSTSFQPFNFASDHLQTRPVRPPILQLKITISKGKSGVIVVREGDDITELAKNFVHTFGLKREQLPKIVDKITKHLEFESEPKQQDFVSLPPPKQSTEQKRRILFNLDVEISEGNSKMLTIRDGDTATNVAKEFSSKYGIGEDAELMLIQLIQYHMKNYLDQKFKEQI